MTSRSEKEAARFLQSTVSETGPLTQTEVRSYAAAMRSKGHGRLAKGLDAVAREMHPRAQITGAVEGAIAPSTFLQRVIEPREPEAEP